MFRTFSQICQPLDPATAGRFAGHDASVRGVFLPKFNHINRLLQAAPATSVAYIQAKTRSGIPLSDDNFRQLLGPVMLVQILGFIQMFGFGNAGAAVEGILFSLGYVAMMAAQLMTLSSVTVENVTVGGNLATITAIGISLVIVIRNHCKDSSIVPFAETSGG